MPIADMAVEMGRLGQKTGAGWFRHGKGSRTPRPDPELARMIKEKAPSSASLSGVLQTKKSSAGSCSPRSTRPARSLSR
jgi:3-hydroxyacyl-CoA dehydrogenase